MMFSNMQTDRGLVKMIIVIVIILIVLGYFGFNIREIINSPTVSDNLSYTQQLMLSVWNNFLKIPLTYIWNEIFIKLIWHPMLETLLRMKDGGPAVTADQAPKLSSQLPYVR